MSDTYRQYFLEHYTYHTRFSNINFVRVNNCPYCKRSRRINYDNNLRVSQPNNVLSSIEQLSNVSRVIREYNNIRDRNMPNVYLIDRHQQNQQQNSSNNNNLYERLNSLEDHVVKTTLETINKHSNIIVNDKKDDQRCVICLKNIKKNEIVRELKCNHSFHIKCIDRWLETNKYCPICKYKLT